MTTTTAIAAYFPQAMIMQISERLPLYDHNGHRLQFRTPTAFGYFFHEYAHFLHNISTMSGISAFVNTVELLRCFRSTVGADGLSRGSDENLPNEHLQRLISYLVAVRRDNAPANRLIENPKSIAFRSHGVQAAVAQADGNPLISAIRCRAEIADSNQTEDVEFSIGTLELLECAALLLEKSVVRSLDTSAPLQRAALFPYEVVAALANQIATDLDERALLASVLAALQSTDAPAALPETMALARGAISRGDDPVAALRSAVQARLNETALTLEDQFQSLEREFSNEGIMAVAMRRIIAAARHAFEMRRSDPFFETTMIDDIAGGASAEDILRRVPSCAVIQEGSGPYDDVQRDVLISFLPVEEGSGRDPEDGLRIVHAVFDYVSRHCAPQGFVATGSATRRACPFYTCCNLELRVADPEVCRREPWGSANWAGWSAGRCWYGSAVSVTNPPAPTPAT